MCGGVNLNMLSSADARMLKFERGISTRKGWKRTAEGGEGPGDCLSPGQTELKIFARRLDFDVAEIHLNLAFSPSRWAKF